MITKRFPEIGVPPIPSSLLMGFSRINHPFLGTPIDGNPASGLSPARSQSPSRWPPERSERLQPWPGGSCDQLPEKTMADRKLVVLIESEDCFD